MKSLFRHLAYYNLTWASFQIAFNYTYIKNVYQIV